MYRTADISALSRKQNIARIYIGLYVRYTNVNNIVSNVFHHPLILFNFFRDDLEMFLWFVCERPLDTWRLGTKMNTLSLSLHTLSKMYPHSNIAAVTDMVRIFFSVRLLVFLFGGYSSIESQYKSLFEIWALYNLYATMATWARFCVPDVLALFYSNLTIFKNYRKIVLESYLKLL